MKHATTDEQIQRCFPVMVELRPHLQAKSFVEQICHQQSEGYQLTYLDDGGKVVAVAGYRITSNLFMGKNLYVDDLITAEHVRSNGYGAKLLSDIRQLAKENGCAHLHLDSGSQRQQAHKFYFRQGLTISSYHFSEKLDDA